MDISKSLLSGVGGIGNQFNADNVKGASEDKKMQLAKDFEGVFIEKLLNEVKNSIDRAKISEDSGSEQIEGLFWTFLGKHISQEGGFGLSKDLYEHFNQLEKAQETAGNLNRKI